MSARKKLIEVALPLEAINAASAREKSIRHGHPSTLHLWWARRPLAACRAVLFAQLVDDPSACPEEFPTEEAQHLERERLFEIIRQLVLWENSTNATVLLNARREIARSAARAHDVKLAPDADAAEVADALRRYAPPVLDPFCGGGSIPLEAQRLGLEAHASDLNPVAVLITKALIEIPPRFRNQPPVHPAPNQAELLARPWRGAQGLAEDVRYYGQWMRAEAEQRIGHLYPKVKLPPEHGGSEATVIAWLWARTVRCPNPACGAQMPLVRSFALSTKKGKEAWVEPIVERLPASATQRGDAIPTPPSPRGRGDGGEVPPAPTIHFAVRTGPGAPPGTVNRRGATCIACGTPVPFDHVRAEGRAGRMGAQLMAIVAEGPSGRMYLPPDEEHIAIAASAEPSNVPDTDLPPQALGFRVQGYGMTKHRHLFTPRQLVALTTFSDLVSEARDRVLADAREARKSDDGIPLAEGGSGATAYADAVATYLAFAVDKMTTTNTSLCSWQTNPTRLVAAFARQAIPMVWDYAEANPFSEAAGDYKLGIGSLTEVLDRLVLGRMGQVCQRDATAGLHDIGQTLISTDPPYYDNIGYADLSDYFYVWLRRSLSKVHPDLFSTLLVPKSQELVATPHRFDGNREKAERFFESGLGRAFGLMRDKQSLRFPLTLFYAFKQVEMDTEDEEATSSVVNVASTGWETMLEGLLQAGYIVTGTWPVRTELIAALKVNVGALASSIVLVCRPRPENAPVTTRRDFLRALRAELPPALTTLTGGQVAPVDLAQAAIGPGMAVFSRYAKVLEPDGSAMRVRTALQQINEVVQTYFAAHEADLDPLSQFCLAWYKQYGTAPGPYGDADTLSRAKNIAVETLARDSLVRAQAGKVQLLPATDPAYGGDWEPRGARPVSLWEAVHRLVAAHTHGGDRAAAVVAYRLGGLADPARDLAYRLYDLASARDHRGATEEAIGYNNLVAAWPAIQKHAADTNTGLDQLGLRL